MKDPNTDTTRGKKNKEYTTQKILHMHTECTDTGSTFYNFVKSKQKHPQHDFVWLKYINEPWAQFGAHFPT